MVVPHGRSRVIVPLEGPLVLVDGTKVTTFVPGRPLFVGPRLVELPRGQICHFKVLVSRPEDVDAELVGWLMAAYERA